MIPRNVLSWFKLKCSYPINSPEYRDSIKRLEDGKYSTRNRLGAEFDAYYVVNNIVFEHHSKDGEEWIATIDGPPPTQKNMKGIQQHGKKWRVERRLNGELQRWTCNTLSEAFSIRDRVFNKGLEKVTWPQEGALQALRGRLSDLVPSHGRSGRQGGLSPDIIDLWHIDRFKFGTVSTTELEQHLSWIHNKRLSNA